MDKEVYEIRSFDGQAAPKVTEDRTIEGYAVVFNQDSRVIYDPHMRRSFIERIDSGAVTEDMLRRSDIKALREHNRERMLARSFNGAGSLTLSIDNYGVKYRFEAPNTQEGNDTLEQIKRGDLFGSSFAYTTDEKNNVSYEKRADGKLYRIVKKIDRMYDVSVVTDPAYMGTTVNARSLDGFFEEPKDEEYKKQVTELRTIVNNRL